MNRFWIALLAGGLIIGFSNVALAGDDHPSLEQVVVEMAETPKQHAALADHYEAKAEKARDEMRRHERMGRSYRVGKATSKAKMRGHCKKLSETYASLADDYEALAKLHEKEAKGH